MQTDELIAKLGASVHAVPRHAADMRLSVALLGGALVAFLLLIALLGVRPDISVASATAPFWIKWVFTLSVAIAAFFVVQRLAQPDLKMGWTRFLLAIPFVFVAMMGMGELAMLPIDQWSDVILGRTSSICSVAILGLAVPVFAGLVWAFRRLAPTRIALAGAAAGILASAVSASVYALACPEQAPAFMMTWYTLGMLAAASLGAITSKLFLRW
jgi:hypothetical protein